MELTETATNSLITQGDDENLQRFAIVTLLDTLTTEVHKSKELRFLSVSIPYWQKLVAILARMTEENR